MDLLDIHGDGVNSPDLHGGKPIPPSIGEDMDLPDLHGDDMDLSIFMERIGIYQSKCGWTRSF
jgi:hypothetical protein